MVMSSTAAVWTLMSAVVPLLCIFCLLNLILEVHAKSFLATKLQNFNQLDLNTPTHISHTLGQTSTPLLAPSFDSAFSGGEKFTNFLNNNEQFATDTKHRNIMIQKQKPRSIFEKEFEKKEIEQDANSKTKNPSPESNYSGSKKLNTSLGFKLANNTGCPNLFDFRSAKVKNGGFDPTKISGKWFEPVLFDELQAGQSCAVLENSLNVNKYGIPGFDQTRKSRFGPIPEAKVWRYDELDADKKSDSGADKQDLTLGTADTNDGLQIASGIASGGITSGALPSDLDPNSLSGTHIGFYMKFVKDSHHYFTNVATVIVDYTEGSESTRKESESTTTSNHKGIANKKPSPSNSGGHDPHSSDPGYSSYTELSCFQIPFVDDPVYELRFSTREAEVSDEEIEALKKSALNAGVDPQLVQKARKMDYARDRCGNMTKSGK